MTPPLFGFLILSDGSYEHLKGFFRWRSVELDRASGFMLYLVDVGNPAVSAGLYELVRSEATRIGNAEAAELFVDDPPLAAREDTHRREVMAALATMLAVGPEERPCIVFVGAGRFEALARFKIEPAWYRTPEGRSALGDTLRDWIANPKLDGIAASRGDRAALAGELQSELDQVRQRVEASFPARGAREVATESPPDFGCHCLDRTSGAGTWLEPKLHTERQDTACPGWVRLEELIAAAVRDRREEFSPGREMTAEEWAQIVTLPPSIARLKSVRHLDLYRSRLVRIPPEIGEMTGLEEFTPYASHRLHWFPFEITRCVNLKRSTVSSRALYGNFKYHPPFPRLPQAEDGHTPRTCSVCDAPLGNSRPIQRWVSLRVATDVLPLLVHACSRECVSKIPMSPEGYVKGPHRGGLALEQPGRRK